MDVLRKDMEMAMVKNKLEAAENLAEIILREMTEKELPRIVLNEALKLVDEKFLKSATI